MQGEKTVLDQSLPDSSTTFRAEIPKSITLRTHMNIMLTAGPPTHSSSKQGCGSETTFVPYCHISIPTFCSDTYFIKGGNDVKRITKIKLLKVF